MKRSAAPRWRHAALLQGDGRVLFQIWAPKNDIVRVRLRPGTDKAIDVELQPDGIGRHAAVVADHAGVDYVYVLDDGREYADPASRWQPYGVHGPSRVVDPSSFLWSDDAWSGIALAEMVIYELHVGTFTRDGTFDAVLEQAGRLRDLGVTTIELMPVAEFPGRRNLGYDGVFPYAPQSSYGGPDGLARLVNGLHAVGLAVLLDVVDNHLGPEGNVLGAFAPYFTDQYRTPWGVALNFDGPESDHVRSYFIESALQWIDDYHVDGLRLDAVHTICDFSARPFLAELAQAVHELGRNLGREVHVIAESDRNDPLAVVEQRNGGLGFDAVWNDDFHHAVHAVLTREVVGYYVDFGRLSHLAKAMGRGFVHDGDYSRFRRRRHGAPSDRIGADRFVVFVQNHDQVGNRARGERLASLVSLQHLRLVAGLLLLSPYIPLLFMGEEYGEPAPFLYFVDHGEPALLEAVRDGRRAEFEAFCWPGDVPDPGCLDTFEQSRIDPSRADEPGPARLLALYKDLLRLKRELPALRPGAALRQVAYDEGEGWIAARYHGCSEGEPLLVGWNFASEPRHIRDLEVAGEGTMRLLICTEDVRYAASLRDSDCAPAPDATPGLLPPLAARLWTEVPVQRKRSRRKPAKGKLQPQPSPHEAGGDQ